MAVIVVILVASSTGGRDLVAASASGRVESGLVVLYDFSEGGGGTVHNRADETGALQLRIADPQSVEWGRGTLTIKASTLIATPEPATKLIMEARQSNALTIEAWVTPADVQQGGPARIVTLSADPTHRNVTLGQEKESIELRLRSTKRDQNGMPATAGPAKALAPRLTHLVATRDPAGTTVLYVDGKESRQESVPGELTNWDAKHRLSLANEITGDRPWKGRLHLVAIYGRALSAAEVRQNFAAGADATIDPEARAAERALALSRSTFDAHVAPLLARHCIECHDPAIRKGGLDLSRREAVLAGGESGPSIVAGRTSQSPLWRLVESDEMPKGRPPLNPREKEALRNWLDSGAVWSVEVIDPANYTHGGQASEVWVQRLTVPEYIETVRSAVGVDIADEARRLLPRDLRADGFNNTAYNLGVDLKHIEVYGRLAGTIVSRMDVRAFASRFSRTRRFDDDKMREVIAEIGKWLLRGPLNEHEINVYRGIVSTVSSAGGEYDDAIAAIVETMLQSPRFIYRIEEQRGDGSPRPVSPHELACRMSYILWGAPPDKPLFDAADKGELSDRRKLEAQVDRMLQDPRTIDRSLRFVSEWLNLGRLENLRPDPGRFPDWNTELAADMREETLAAFREVVWTQRRPLSDVLSAQVTFATPRLARHYGLKPAGDGLTRYDLSGVPSRGGLLTQGSVLTIGGDDASMVTRGLFVLHDLLRGTISAPPPCVNTTPPPTQPGLSLRAIAESRVADVNCGVCHGRFEPLAFGLERYDGVGAYRERDQHGNALRDDGEVLFPGTAQPVKYSTAAELMDLLSKSERVRECLTWKLAQFSLGRPLSAADAPLLTEIHDTAERNGGTYESLIKAIVLSDLVQTARTETDR